MQRIPPFRTLDALRGFAALWVVMDHSCDRFLGGANPSLAQQPLYAFSMRGALGVVIFFVISGYCITAAAHSALYSGKSLLRYSFERGRRIFPPYWTVLILGLFMKSGLRMAEAHHWIAKVNHSEAIVLFTSPLYWFANLTLTQFEWSVGFENIVFWSLCYEVAFYAVVGVWLWISQRVAHTRDIAAGQLTLILGLAATTFASLLVLILFGASIFPFDLWHQFALGGILFYLIESSKGTVAGYSPGLRRTLNGIAAITVVLSIVYIAFRQVGWVDAGHPSSKVRTATCLLLCILLAGIRRFDAKIVESGWLQPLIWLGASSYSLYLIHPLVLPFIDVSARKLGLDGNRYWIAFLIQVIAAVGFGRLFYMLVESHFISSRQVKRLKEEHAA